MKTSRSHHQPLYQEDILSLLNKDTPDCSALLPHFLSFRCWTDEKAARGMHPDTRVQYYPSLPLHECSVHIASVLLPLPTFPPFLLWSDNRNPVFYLRLRSAPDKYWFLSG